MRKILGLLLAFAFSITSVQAESLNKVLSNLGVNKSAVSISIKEVKTGNTLFELNERVPRVPASTLKVLTSAIALDTLGPDYALKTQFYKSTNNDVYLKLAGDPLLTTKDLEKLMITAREKNIEPKTFYIDNSIFDNVEWGEGWQWDDALNPLMPKFSAFNINGNMTTLVVKPTHIGAVANVSTKPFYPYSFMNTVVTDLKAQNDVKFERFVSESPVFSVEAQRNMLALSGSVSKVYSKSIPVLSPSINFVLRLKDSIHSSKFQYFGVFVKANLPKEEVYLIDEVTRELPPILNKILKSSDNLAAESLFKHAGSVWAKKTKQRTY